MISADCPICGWHYSHREGRAVHVKATQHEKNEKHPTVISFARPPEKPDEPEQLRLDFGQ